MKYLRVVSFIVAGLASMKVEASNKFPDFQTALFVLFVALALGAISIFIKPRRKSIP